jgi:hypothetical protein
MSGAARNSGSKLVVVAVGATLAMVGVATIWLPFVADKDKVRGLHEESEVGGGAAQREYDALLRQMGAAGVDKNQSNNNKEKKTAPPPPRPSNSMWSRFKPSS